MFNLRAIKLKDTQALELEPVPKVFALTGSGDIEVRSHEADTLKITLEITVKAPTEARATQMLEELRRDPPVERLNGSVTIGDLSRYGFAGALDTSVIMSIALLTPHATAFKLKSGSGNQRVRHVRGPLEARVGSGDIDVEGLEDALMASTGSGDLSVQGANRVEGRTGSGNITLHEIRSDIEVKTGSGNIMLSKVAGGVQAKSSSGEITIVSETAVKTRWQLKVSSGNIRATVGRESSFALDAKTASGRVDVAVPLSQVAVQRSRQVKGQTDDAPEGLLELKSSSGNISVR